MSTVADHPAPIEGSREQTRPRSHLAREGVLLRLGGACAIFGSAANVASSAAHGDLPNTSTAASLDFVASRGAWSAVHLGGIVGVLLWVGALVVLANSLEHGAGWAWARLATAVAFVGGAVYVVFFSIDGVALKATADAWAAAPPAERAGLLRSGGLVLLLQESQFHSAIAFLLGLPFVLFGLAVASGRTYPAWLGWVGTIAGAGALVTGMTRFVGLDLVPDPVLFGGFGLVLSLWMAIMGVLMWRRAVPRGGGTTAIAA